MHPSKVTVTKSVTLEKRKRWEKAEFSIEVSLDQNDDPETAKLWVESLLDIWITEFEKSK